MQVVESTLERIRQVAAGVLKLPAEQITPDSSPDQIENWDSLGHVHLVLGLEQEFGRRFSPEQIESMTDIQSIVDIVTSGE